MLGVLVVALLFAASSLAGGSLCRAPVALAGAGFDTPEAIASAWQLSNLIRPRGGAPDQDAPGFTTSETLSR